MGASTTGPQRSNLTHVDGVAVTSSAGKPHAVGVLAGIHGSVSFGSTETQHDTSLAGLSAAAIGEIAVRFTGPFETLDSTNHRWTVSCEVINTTTLRFYRIAHQSGATSADLLPSTHYFNAQRVVLP
jgi:hypothetical protein